MLSFFFPYNFYFSYLNASLGKEDIVVHFYIHHTALPNINTKIIKMCEWVSASPLEFSHLGTNC